MDFPRPIRAFFPLLVVLWAGCADQVHGDAAAPWRWFRSEDSRSVVTSVQPLRRLTRREYNNTVRDLLGDHSAPADAFPSEGTGSSGFSSPGAVSDVEARRFLEAAEDLAARASQHTDSLADCQPSRTRGGDIGCARRFVQEFGHRAFRRPLSREEIDEHLALYTQARAGQHLDHAGGIRIVLTAFLQSPLFLYHWEEGTVVTTDHGPVFKLGAHALASRLSYFFWASMPDAPLMAAADAGRLERPDQVERQARRLLQDPHAADMVGDFHAQWLRLHRLKGMVKDKKAYKEFDPALATAMELETKTFATHVVLEEGGKLGDLLDAPFTYVNSPLAHLYGISDVAHGDLQRTQLDPEQRAGLLTQASFLSIGANAYESSPILRGKFVREQLLCQPMTPPPPGVPPLTPPAETTTLRARLEDHVLNGSCSRCHTLMDPIGFGLEAYDAIGRFAPAPGGKPLDLTGTVKNIDGADRSFTGARQLATLLAQSPEVTRCMTRQFFRYAFGRQESTEDDSSIQSAHAAFEHSGWNVRELLVALARSPSFRYRRPDTGEALP